MCSRRLTARDFGSHRGFVGNSPPVYTTSPFHGAICCLWRTDSGKPVAQPGGLRRYCLGGQFGGQFGKSPATLCDVGVGSERVGFEPTVRLPVQRFSGSKILMLGRAVL